MKKQSNYRRIFSFQKFVVKKEYDPNLDMYDYYIYGRVGLFFYVQLSQVDSMSFDALDEFE